MSHNKDYIVQYVAFDAAGKTLKSGKIRAKNKLSKFDAMAGTENFLKSKDKNIHRIQVVNCSGDNMVTLHDDFEEMFMRK